MKEHGTGKDPEQPVTLMTTVASGNGDRHRCFVHASTTNRVTAPDAPARKVRRAIMLAPCAGERSP